MKSKLIAVFIIFLSLLCLSSCSVHETWEGIDNWHPHLSSSSITSEYAFLDRDFLTSYPYKEGNFYFDTFSPSYFRFGTDKSFLWLTYEDLDIYQNAKQSRFDSRERTVVVTFDGTQAFGFTFYLYSDFSNLPGVPDGKTHFPDWFTAFGYNDETQTLIMIGFYCAQPKKEPNIEYATKDFSLFLTHYYGDWFDWETGVGRSSSTENSN